MSRTLVLTNDFPPRRGGIETFVHALCEELEAADPGSVVVYTAAMRGDPEVDAALPYPVHRDPRSMLLPTPAVARRVGAVLRAEGCDRVLVGSSVPLGLLVPGLRRAGAVRAVALTHGHEVWWARLPGPRALLRRVGAACDVVTFVSDWCRQRIAPALVRGPGEDGLVRLTPGVDVDRFRPGCGGDTVRARLGWHPDTPVVVCVARMVRRKGQDTLVAAWPEVARQVPGARLLLVGDGPRREHVRRLAATLGVAEAVHVAGSVPWEDVPAYTDAGDVFAMPCRTRRGGLEVEAFGIVFLEAAACGLPVVVGRSGGAPETVEDGVTGRVVDPTALGALVTTLVGLLRDPDAAQEMGKAGRDRAVAGFTWRAAGTQVRALLQG